MITKEKGNNAISARSPAGIDFLKKIYTRSSLPNTIKNSLLLDFSLALTKLHCIFVKILSKDRNIGIKHIDLVKFDKVS